jgi:hypothetical protein
MKEMSDMSNYIFSLKDQVSVKDAEIEALREGLVDLSCYLTSSKFHIDTTVQVADVLRRIQDIISMAGDRVDHQHRINSSLQDARVLELQQKRQQKREREIEDWENRIAAQG